MKSDVFLLSNDRIFSGLGEDEIFELVEKAEAGKARRRQIIFKPTDLSDCVYWIKSGRIKLYHLTEDGREIILRLFRPGDIFGEMAFLESGPRDYFAEALEDLQYFSIKRNHLLSMAKRKPILIYRFAKLIGERRRESEMSLTSRLYKGVRGRLAWQLLNLAERYGINDNRGKLMTVKFTHKELACLIGSSRETVSLTISELRDMGIIEMNTDRKLIIRDEKNLSLLV